MKWKHQIKTNSNFEISQFGTNPNYNSRKTVSRKERQERKGKTPSYQALAFHPIGFGSLSPYVFEFLCGLCDFARVNAVFDNIFN
jgi:hypothetical protein